MKYYKITIFFLFIALLTHAQKDPEAERVLKQVEKKANAYKSLTADFDYVLKNPDQSEEVFQGSVVIKGTMFKMSLDETITFSNGKTRWVYLVQSNEVNVSDIISSEDLEYDEKFLVDPMSIYSIYKEGFKYALNTALADGKSKYVLDLIPEDISAHFFKVRCWITNDYDLKAIKYFLKDGTRMTLELKNFKVDKKMSDREFEFNVKDYPDVEVIDM